MKEFEAHILVIDDDKGIRELVKEYLNENNFITSTAKDAIEAKEKISLIKFDLIILDIMMPGKSGLEFLKENKSHLDTPIILLTAKGEAINRIEGLETGADDYLAKPFEPKELILRIRNILNRTNIIKDRKEIEFGNIKINLNKMIVYKNNKQIKINNTEKKIFEKMLNSPGKELINIDKERSIDVVVTRLRKKIEDNPKNPKYLQTIRGEGYVLWVE